MNQQQVNVKLVELNLQKVAIHQEIAHYEEILKGMTAMKDRYPGMASQRQLSFVQGLLRQHQYESAHFVLDKWECHCIIAVLSNNSDNEEILDGFSDACYPVQETFEEFIYQAKLRIREKNCATRTELIRIFGEKVFRDMKKMVAEHTSMDYVSRITRDIVEEHDISEQYMGQAAYI